MEERESIKDRKGCCRNGDYSSLTPSQKRRACLRHRRRVAQTIDAIHLRLALIGAILLVSMINMALFLRVAPALKEALRSTLRGNPGTWPMTTASMITTITTTTMPMTTTMTSTLVSPVATRSAPTKAERIVTMATNLRDLYDQARVKAAKNVVFGALASVIHRRTAEIERKLGEFEKSIITPTNPCFLAQKYLEEFSGDRMENIMEKSLQKHAKIDVEWRPSPRSKWGGVLYVFAHR